MAENKTKPTQVDVGAFLETVGDPRKREDSRTLCTLMERISGEPATMWGPSIIGFGSYHYRYDSGREGDICRIGFSPRAAALTLYVLAGSPEQEQLLAGLGKHKVGGGCLYIKRLSNVDIDALERLVAAGWTHMLVKHPA